MCAKCNIGFWYRKIISKASYTPMSFLNKMPLCNVSEKNKLLHQTEINAKCVAPVKRTVLHDLRS